MGFTVPNEEQLEEKRSVEESDNLLTIALFSGEEDDLLREEFTKNETKSIVKPLSKTKKKQVSSKQKENELIQKK